MVDLDVLLPVFRVSGSYSPFELSYRFKTPEFVELKPVLAGIVGVEYLGEITVTFPVAVPQHFFMLNGSMVIHALTDPGQTGTDEYRSQLFRKFNTVTVVDDVLPDQSVAVMDDITDLLICQMRQVWQFLTDVLVKVFIHCTKYLLTKPGCFEVWFSC